MKVVIAGGRDFEDYGMLKNFMYDLHTAGKLDIETITEVVSGTCPGADLLGEQWAEEEQSWPHFTKGKLPIKRFAPDWDTLGRAAGPIRNKAMAQYGDVLVALWDGKSRGTKNMIDHMNRLKKPVFIGYWNKEEDTNK